MNGERDRNARTWQSGMRRAGAGLGRAGRALTASRRHAGLLSAVTVAAAVALVPTAGAAASGPVQAPRAGAGPGHSAMTQPPPGPFVTLLFSRTEISAADNCVE